MEIYTSVASFAQTWGLIYFIAGFAIVLIYAFRPSARKKFDDAAQMPLRED